MATRSRRYSLRRVGNEDNEIPKQELFDDVMRAWNRTIEEYEIKPLDLFEQIVLVDPYRAENEECFVTWCPISDFVAVKYQLQKSLEDGRFFSALSRAGKWTYSAGQSITAHHLWRASHDSQLTSALLLAASLFAQMGSSRATYPRDNWPSFREAEKAKSAVTSYIEEKMDAFDGWHYSCTGVLPPCRRGHYYNYKLHDLGALSSYLAEEHARLYAKYKILGVNFVKSPQKKHLKQVPS